MPLVRDREIAAWNSLQEEGIQTLAPDEVWNSTLSEIHIGFLNMMPDRALRATERQFIRLIAAAADNTLIYVHPFTIGGLGREAGALDYVERYYDSFSDIGVRNLDGLVLTGANPGVSDLKDEKFWPEFEEVIHWADRNVPTILCSCLASHAILNIFHGIQRTRCLPGKRWGVFSHQLSDAKHPLVNGMADQFDVPRSHVFEMKAQQLEKFGVRILAHSQEADFHIAVSSDGFKWIFLQGHPEYDSVSLLKEYNREIRRLVAGERSDYPQYPEHYLATSAKAKLDEYRLSLTNAMKKGDALPVFPESDILPTVQNTWTSQGKIMFKNWIELVSDQVNAGQEQSRVAESV